MNDERFPDLKGFTKTLTVDEWGYVHCRYDEDVVTPVPRDPNHVHVTGGSAVCCCRSCTDPDAVQAAAFRALTARLRDDPLPFDVWLCSRCRRTVPLTNHKCTCGCDTFVVEGKEHVLLPSPTPPKSDAGATGNDDEPHIVKGN